MRILGSCPSCHKENTLVVPQRLGISSHVACNLCGKKWEDYNSLLDSSQSLAHRLILVDIFRIGASAGVMRPSYDEIPHAPLIQSMLNAALYRKFNMRVCFAMEGGLTRRQQPWYELRNNNRSLGLHFEEGEYDAAHGAIDCYEGLLRRVFEEPFQIGATKMEPGEILRLERMPETKGDAEILLFGAIASVEGRRFARNVWRTYRYLQGGLMSGAYLRGLTDKEFLQVYVPPRFK